MSGGDAADAPAADALGADLADALGADVADAPGADKPGALAAAALVAAALAAAPDVNRSAAFAVRIEPATTPAFSAARPMRSAAVARDPRRMATAVPAVDVAAFRKALPRERERAIPVRTP